MASAAGESTPAVEDGAVSLPPMVYVPTRQAHCQAEDIEVELRPLEDGRVALLAYSALDRLVACCGDAQPWALLPASAVDEVAEGTPFDVVLLDIELPEELRHATVPDRVNGADRGTGIEGAASHRVEEGP